MPGKRGTTRLLSGLAIATVLESGGSQSWVKGPQHNGLPEPQHAPSFHSGFTAEDTSIPGVTVWTSKAAAAGRRERPAFRSTRTQNCCIGGNGVDVDGNGDYMSEDDEDDLSAELLTEEYDDEDNEEEDEPRDEDDDDYRHDEDDENDGEGDRGLGLGLGIGGEVVGAALHGDRDRDESFDEDPFGGGGEDNGDDDDCSDTEEYTSDEEGEGVYHEDEVILVGTSSMSGEGGDG
ncbi:unnamed protein product, partial [Choristocarpus tenellus]